MMPLRCWRTVFASVLACVAVAGCSTDSAGGSRVTPGLDVTPAVGASRTTPATPRCSPPYPTGTPTADTVECGDPASFRNAQVLRIVDGDTLHVRIDGSDETVRLYGINATEVGQPCSEEATARLKQLAGASVNLRPDARDRDRYSRLLRYVYTADGLSIDAELVAEGLAHAWQQDGILRHAIIELELRAAGAHTGCLWQ